MGKTKNKEERLGFGTLLLWQSRAISSSVSYLLISTFLMMYCTDALKVPAAVISAILVGSKFIDGVTDMVAGFIVDKTKTRWGKARPYEVFIIFMWLFTWLLFSCPESLSTAVKCVWIFIMYALVNSICNTFLNANNAPYLVRAFKNTQIVKLTSFGSIFTMLTGLIFNIFFPMAMGKIAVDAAGWSRLALMMAVPLGVIGILRMIFVEEKYDVDSESGGENEPLKIQDAFKLFKVNKYIILITLVNFVFNFVCNLNVTSYYYKYIVGNIGAMGLASAATIVAIPMAFAFPPLIKKFSTSKLMMAGFFVAAAGYLLNFMAKDNIPLLMIGAILTGGGAVPASMLLTLVIIDCADYNEWRGIHRMEGTMSSVVGLGKKIGSAIGAGALGVFLQFSGYTGDAATMPSSAFVMIRLLMSFIPMALYIFTGIAMNTYKLDKQLPQIKADLEDKRRKENIDLSMNEDEHGKV